MRGRVLHAGGRRPQYRQADGSFLDQDPLDRCAYHILLRSSAYLIGCIRVVPLTSVPTCGTESLLGHQRFEHLLVNIGTTRDRAGEVGRWIVAPEYSRFRMGLRLISGVGALSKWLGLETVIANVGTRDGQAEILMRAGGRRVPGLSPIKSQEYNDDLVVLTFDLMHPAKSLGPLVAEMATLLSLEQGNEARELPNGFPMQMAYPLLASLGPMAGLAANGGSGAGLLGSGHRGNRAATEVCMTNMEGSTLTGGGAKCGESSE
jgi:GNAT acetyltransferase-like protein